jgi:glucose-6-phosphate dehydrogenase assembly protein OpcA
MPTNSTTAPAIGPDTASSGEPSIAVDGVLLWDEIRRINQDLRQATDPVTRADLAWRRAAAWEQLTLLAVDVGEPPWYAAACACITEVSTEAAERIAGRRPPRPLL